MNKGTKEEGEEKLLDKMMNPAEYVADLGLGLIKKKLNEKISYKIDEKKLLRRLNNYISQQRKYNEVCTIAEEIDFQGLIEYIQNNFIDDAYKSIFAIKASERSLALNHVLAATIDHSKAETEEAKRRVAKSISICIEIIKTFYHKDISKQDYILAIQIVDEIRSNTEEIVGVVAGRLGEKVDGISVEVKQLKNNFSSPTSMHNDDSMNLTTEMIHETTTTNSDTQNLFYDTTNSLEYKLFIHNVLLKYYGEEFFTSINGHLYSTYTIEGIKIETCKYVKDLDFICDSDNSNFDFDIKNHRNYSHFKWYDEYSKIVGHNLRFPHRPGYMLDSLKLNNKEQITSVSVHIGTYGETVYSNHILEYELFKIFMKYKNKDVSKQEVWSELHKDFEIRNSFHPNIDRTDNVHYRKKMLESLCCGCNRESLLGVQMLVIIKDVRTKKYKMKMIMRSEDVAIAPNVYQFIPSGGFEVLNDSKDNKYDKLELKSNFSVGGAVFREYLEELCDISEYDGHYKGSIEELLFNNEKIYEIEEMLSDKTATLQFLGSVINLVTLRQELSFVLVVDDTKYSKNQFIPNYESRKGRIIEDVSVDNFESVEELWENMYGSSAAMWYLFKNTELYSHCLQP